MNSSLIRNMTIEELLHYHMIGELDCKQAIDSIENYLTYLEDFIPLESEEKDLQEALGFEYDSGKDIGYVEGYNQGYEDGFFGRDQPEDLQFIELPEIIRRNL